jgi:hypothetical protein
MGIIAVCGGLFAVGLAAIVLWGGLRLPPAAPLPADDDRPAPLGFRFLWWLTVAAIAGVTSGVLIAGAGGRLAMRLIAQQSPEAHGQITEAQATVGEISIDGTIGLFIFGGLPAGVVAAAIYVAIQRWMPRGPLGGFVFGLLLLTVLAPRIEPLRADNIDFAIVGPGWLSLTVLSALVILEGMFVAAVTSRLSRALPLAANGKVWPYVLSLPAIIVLVLVLPVAVIVSPVDGALTLVLLLAMPVIHSASRRLLGDRRPDSGWRESVPALVAIGLIVAASLPRFATSLLQISTL